MKILFLIGCLFVWHSLHSQSNEGFGSMPYTIKSGKIVYHFSNLMQEGTKTVTFDDSGRYIKVIIEAHLIVDTVGFASLDSNVAKVIHFSSVG